MTGFHPRAAWLVTCVCALGAACISAAACGSGGDGNTTSASASERRSIETAIAEARAAFANRDAERVCARLSRRGQLIMGTAAHQRASNCRRDIQRYFRWITPAAAPRVRAVRVDGDRARADLRLTSGATISMPLTRERGEWKLAGVFNVTLSSIQDDALGIVPPPDARPPRRPAAPDALAIRQRVAVWDPSGAQATRCPSATADFFPTVVGGCKLEVRGRATVAMLSPFGTMKFASCRLSYELYVGGDGQTWAKKFGVGGPQPCTDASVCVHNGDPVPWRGQIYRTNDGTVRHRIYDTCFDTCVGRFRGDMTTTLERPEHGWRQRADEATAGLSGYRLDGIWRATSGQIVVTGSGDPPPATP